jgi:hypothetical protein
LTSLEWKVLKSNKDFLECAFKCTNIASGKNYATLSMQPLIWELLEKMCTGTINGSTQTGFTTPAVKMVASAMLEKLLKYYDNSKSQLNRVALFLDPRFSNSTPDMLRGRRTAPRTHPNRARVWRECGKVPNFTIRCVLLFLSTRLNTTLKHIIILNYSNNY